MASSSLSHTDTLSVSRLLADRSHSWVAMGVGVGCRRAGVGCCEADLPD